ncbi:DUF2141 domain-containing protein [Sphingomonas sp. PP-CE-1G-424]|uniref:DUF2141 domain-containing protein n=1 Tax=Sphingomonas sp. PP-CE-1G-424 TaxID=2135658 RepID=UPI00105676C2|nr:DUF2141 domain-containing protein [Sphingomonas sp. PP-CE-1G-424]TCP66754.1 uncharacterized protein (DUF2141 family) [Sphingomonas sp. PP-CE-1G-424]
MNPLFLMILAAVAVLAPIQAQAAESCQGTPGNGNARLILEATTMHNAVGEVAFTVYPDDKKRFLAKGGKLVRARVSAASPHACFWLKPGYYAIAQYHDENSDHDFNRTLFVPKEGFGFSNDAPTSIGLPSFASVRTALPASGTTVRMKMRYRR